jgi:hypothetical protein
MSPAEEAVMGAVRSLPEAVRRNGFKRGELPVGDLDARRVQDVLKSLSESGHIECEKRCGPGGYRYTVPRDPGESVLGISLSPRGEEADADDDGPEDLTHAPVGVVGALGVDDGAVRSQLAGDPQRLEVGDGAAGC